MTMVHFQQKNWDNPILFARQLLHEDLLHTRLHEILIHPCIFVRHKTHLWEKCWTPTWSGPSLEDYEGWKHSTRSCDHHSECNTHHITCWLVDINYAGTMAIWTPFPMERKWDWSLIHLLVESVVLFGPASACLASNTQTFTQHQMDITLTFVLRN